MSKKRRLAEGFSPDAIAGGLAEKTRIQEEMEDIVLKLQGSDCSYILKNLVQLGTFWCRLVQFGADWCNSVQLGAD